MYASVPCACNALRDQKRVLNSWNWSYGLLLVTTVPKLLGLEPESSGRTVSVCSHLRSHLLLSPLLSFLRQDLPTATAVLELNL